MTHFEQHQQQAPQSGLFKKTKMCKFKRLGMCTRGEGCTYAHHESELCPLPNLFKTKMCFEMSKNRACQNPTCPYAHTKTELRNVVYENSKIEEGLKRRERQEMSNAQYFVAAKPIYWYSLMTADPCMTPLSDGTRTPLKKSFFDSSKAQAMQVPASPCSTFISPSPTPSEDSGSWTETPSRRSAGHKEMCSLSQMSSDESDLSESETFQAPPPAPTMKWTIKNTLLELCLDESESMDDAAVPRALRRCSSSPVFM